MPTAAPDRTVTPVSAHSYVPAEPDSEFRVVRQLTADDLHRYQPSARRTARETDVHATGSGPPDQAVQPDSLRVPAGVSLVGFLMAAATGMAIPGSKYP
jgi:hypothetical protein